MLSPLPNHTYDEFAMLTVEVLFRDSFFTFWIVPGYSHPASPSAMPVSDSTKLVWRCSTHGCTSTTGILYLQGHNTAYLYQSGRARRQRALT